MHLRLITTSARTIPTGLHAVSNLSRFPHVLSPLAYMRFHACHDFRMYNSCGRTCSFRLVTFSACTIPAGVHAVSGSSRFPHVLFLSGYRRFSACLNFRMYYFCPGTCAFRLVTIFACTISAGVHAVSGLSRVPHVLFLPRYMRFSACLNFRMYYFCPGTCTFALVMISARTIPTGLHAVFNLPQFPHVQFSQACMRFLTCHVFRTYLARRTARRPDVII